MSENENRTNELNEALKEIWDSLTDEQKEEAKNCENMDELINLAGKYRIELPDELLENVAGGLIVFAGRQYYVMDDKNLVQMRGIKKNIDDANKCADYWRVSHDLVTEAEYRNMGGKAKFGYC
ncbi:MAG: hypothetical protein K6A90_12545 [Lachnospiraceae bacterium]|nr:hypothetical protein [Lachnospiraceae bacterium]